MRGVLGEHGGGDGAAALQRTQRFAGDQRLAAQDAVLIGERKPDDLEFLLFDDAAQAAGRLFLLARPQTVTLDKTQRVIPCSSLRGALATKQSTRTVCARVWIASLSTGGALHRPLARNDVERPSLDDFQ